MSEAAWTLCGVGWILYGVGCMFTFVAWIRWITSFQNLGLGDFIITIGISSFSWFSFFGLMFFNWLEDVNDKVTVFKKREPRE